jgi:hypothetical protein
VRIGTWNVEYARPSRLSALRDTLVSNPADIWVLTETHDHLSPPGCPFAAHAEPRPKEAAAVRPGSRWASIWSAFPILEQVRLDGADHERTVVAALDLGTHGRMIVYGTVLPWKGDRGKQHHRVVAQQAREWRELRERFADASMCVAGDYNTDMGGGGPYGGRAGVAALEQGLGECSMYCATAPTAIGDWPLAQPLIDHIALPVAWRSSTRLAAAWPAQKRMSDHCGLVLDTSAALS